MLIESNLSDVKSVPEVITGFWNLNGIEYEFNDIGQYFVVDLPAPFHLDDNGKRLILNERIYHRLYGSSSVIGVWGYEGDYDKEMILREDSTVTTHTSYADFFGKYCLDGNKFIQSHLRAYYVISGSHITFYPHFAQTEKGKWSVQDNKLTITLTSGEHVYERSSGI